MKIIYEEESEIKIDSPYFDVVGSTYKNIRTFRDINVM
jgi:hypothetical protein